MKYESESNAAEPKVAVIIVNWNGLKDTCECLASLGSLRYRNWTAIVVDNGSSDASVPEIRRKFPTVRVMPVGKNLGFAEGCNVGMRLALCDGADFVWLLNNDAVVLPDALDLMVAAARLHSQMNFVGSWIAYYDRTDTIWYGGGLYHRRTGRFIHELLGLKVTPKGTNWAIRETQWITGCSLMVRTDALRRYGLMDESYFLYREEGEWQLRCSSNRPRAIIVEKALVLHKVGQSTGSTAGFLGMAFQSRNFLKLAARFGGVYWPVWISYWIASNFLLPILKFNWLRPRASFWGLMTVRADGVEALMKIRARSSGAR